MGNCYFKKCSIIFNQSEIDVIEKNGKKEEDSKKEIIIKTDSENNNNNLNKLQISNRDNKKIKEDYKETKENENKNETEAVKRPYVKHKVKKEIKTKTIIPLNNRLGFKINKSNKNIDNNNFISDNDESINKDKESSVFDFNDSENNNAKSKKKFKRKNVKSVTIIDKSLLNQKLIDYEMSIPILTDHLIINQGGNLKENYEIKKKIGSGPYGVVYKAKNIYLKNLVAIKIIKKAKDNKEDDLNIEKQINIIKKLNHPNIVKLYQFYSDKDYYQIITEYFKKGELSNYIKMGFSEKQLAVIFYQILSGLIYLHDKNIVHKNVKLHNIMIAEKDEDNITKEEYFWIKIVDFQTDANFQNNEKQKNLKENSYYSSPESLKNNYIDKSDIWSVGVILHIALTGKFPYDGETEEEINYKIMNINYNILDPRLFAHSPEVKDLLDKLLQKDINNRLSAKEALEHEWFKNYNGRALFNNFKLDEIQHYINNLCNYSLESKIYQLVIAFIVHNMSYPSYIYTIQKIYRYFNLSGNCKLTKDELKKGLYNYRSETQIDSIVDKLFVLLDGDNNGYIEFEEFLRACIDKNKILTKENLWYAFKFLDKKNKNSIDAQTLMRAFDAKPNKMLEAVFNKTLNDGDLDNNREISFEEFEEIMKNTLK